MHKPLPSLFVCTIAVASLLAGCNSAGPQRRPEFSGQPVLAGKTVYLDGQVEVSAQLSPFRLHGPPPGEGAPARGGNEDRSKKRKPERRGDNMGEGFKIDNAPPPREMDNADEDGVVRPPRWIGSASRQTIVITIRNTGTQPVALRVEDVTSPIGNFVPFPDSITLQPGAEQVLEPMRASYPDAIEQLDVTVRIGSGEKHEEHAVRLTVVAPPDGG